MNRLSLTILALALCSCGTPLGRLNPGAPFPYVVVSDAEMAKEHASSPVPFGWVVAGTCNHQRITELQNGATAWSPAHECAHRADTMGSYRAAIESLTPPNPNQEMAARLKVMWEIEAGGSDYWLTIYKRWGREAIGGHTEILARIEGGRP